MGCFVSTPKDTGGRRRPGNIGEVAVFVPGLRIPKPVDFTESLGDHLGKSLVVRLSALRTRIVEWQDKKLQLSQEHGEEVLPNMVAIKNDFNIYCC